MDGGKGEHVDKEDGLPPLGADCQVAPPHEEPEGNEMEAEEAEAEEPATEPWQEEKVEKKEVAAEGEQRAKRSQNE